MVFFEREKPNETTKTATATTNCELELESGRCIRYVAPAHALPGKPNNDPYYSGARVRKISTYDQNDRSDDWEGVSILCQALDTAFKYESESLVAGKSILEMGFCTGLPSVFSLTNRAAHVTLFSMEEIIMNDCVKPTLARNKVKPTQKRLIFGEFSDLRKSTDQNRFDIILASEYLNTDKFSYEELHDIIDYLLTPDGLCIFSSRMSYFHHEGSLPEFIDLIKVKGKFDVFERWSSPKSDFVQRKVIQLTRVIR